MATDRAAWKHTLQAWIYVLPALLVIGVFSVYPIVQLVDLSFQTDSNFFTGAVYSHGLGNYEYVLGDRHFRQAAMNTVYYAAAVIPVKLALALAIALLLNRTARFGKWLRTVYLLPLVTSVVALSMVWRLMFHSEYGLLNRLLDWIGMEPVGWLTQPEWALPSVMLFHIWRDCSYYILFFLAGLQTVDRDCLLAARADGATPWQQTLHITLPLLAPTIRFTVVIATMEAFKAFDEVYTLFPNRTGPLDSAMTVSVYIFQKFYGQAEYGPAAAAACMLLAVIAVVAACQSRMKYRRTRS